MQIIWLKLVLTFLYICILPFDEKRHVHGKCYTCWWIIMEFFIVPFLVGLYYWSWFCFFCHDCRWRKLFHDFGNLKTSLCRWMVIIQSHVCFWTSLPSSDLSCWMAERTMTSMTAVPSELLSLMSILSHVKCTNLLGTKFGGTTAPVSMSIVQSVLSAKAVSTGFKLF